MIDVHSVLSGTAQNSESARNDVGRYYESYMTDNSKGYQQTDLIQRADNYNKLYFT